MEYEVSVVLLTYNADFEKLKSTINSVINQESINMELVIADDGSEEFSCQKIEQYLKGRDFEHYTIIHNSKNQGTVKNYLSGIYRATGKYIKGISPGDFFYDTQSLRKMIDYMKLHMYQVCFGKAVYYCKESEQYKIISHHNPFDLDVYRNRNEKKILKNYFVYQDYALGANFVVERVLLKNSLEKIEKKVTYAEDTSVLYMLANGEKLGFFDDYIIWYEYGTGISTNTSDKWNRILYNENKAVYEMIKEKCMLAQKGYVYNFNQMRNRYFEMVRKIIISPQSIFFWIKKFGIKEKQNRNISTELLNNIIK